jgi:hypothetical protein
MAGGAGPRDPSLMAPDPTYRPAHPGEHLPEIELRLLELAAGGASIAQLSTRLHRSDADVRHLIADVEHRLDCDSLSLATASALATGVIHRPR